MKYDAGQFRLSATDVAGHLACRHLTMLDRLAALGEIEAPANWDPFLEVMREHGLRHEKAYLSQLEQSGGRLVRIEGAGVEPRRVAETIAAMREGAAFIVQAPLSNGIWQGRADVLRRIPMKTKLGDWGYEVIDTKLSRETKGGTILQLCLYSELVGAIQGPMAECMYVVTPWSRLDPEKHRTSDYIAYHRFVRKRLERAVELKAGTTPTYPDPKPHCDICRWDRDCDRRRHDDDHPSLVAGISKLQIGELAERDIATMTALSGVALPLPWKPKRGAARSYERVREQARVQVEGRAKQQPIFEALTPEPGFGLSRLPEPSAGDVFFDFEGDTFAGEGGLEYLFGYTVKGEDATLHYTGQWALTRDEEKRAFESFVDWVMAHWQRHPEMHIYHYAPYEPAALKRLMGRYASREDEVDRMLRGRLFVDLYGVVRHGIRASVESYSIKKLEPFYGFERATALSKANGALARLEASLELYGIESIRDEDRTIVEGYNRDDCASAHALRDWLETIRSTLIAEGATIERPGPEKKEASRKVDERAQRVQSVHDRLVRDVPIDAAERSEEQQAKWLLANILAWHRREEKSVWWEYFRLEALRADELLDERDAISGLSFLDTVGGTKKCPIHRYEFPPQETDLRGGEQLRNVGGAKFGEVEAVDLNARTIDITKRQDSARIHPEAVFAHDWFNPEPLPEALLNLGKEVVTQGVATGDNLPARNLLLRRPPALQGEPIRKPNETTLDAALRIAPKLEGNVLAIQGPPGTGKTFTAARMICQLALAGARVGITANSHKVIGNLLRQTVDAARDSSGTLDAIQKIRDGEEPQGDEHRAEIAVTTDNAALLDALNAGVKIAAGTAWLWARPEARRCVDVLFVDEAAQLSLANVLAVSQAGGALVLIGDPQQLDQPLKGSHPEGTDVSALAHILGGQKIIGGAQGLFLDQTWRLHPKICSFTSEMFYEDQLTSVECLEQQTIVCDGPLSGNGLRFFPVRHSGNQNSSAEEADLIAVMVRRLLAGKPSWVDQEGREKPLTLHDVLIIAPYNAHVFALKERLSDARIGTVDKFQGQEAPITIYAMATSTPEDAPRGMEFLYSLNRLNVATSRARCISALVASPDLFEPECRTPRQIQLANALCRFREMAVECAV
jgi:uncharacterized protein